MTYPSVIGEQTTLRLVLDGRSLARYGDGEFRLCRNVGIPCQRFERSLAERLRGLLRESGECLVGIPNINSDTPKRAFWDTQRQYGDLLSDRMYMSAFVTRPDSAPWINTPAYWDAVESLWKDQEVTLVRGGQRSLMASDLLGAAHVEEVIGPRLHAWRAYKPLMAKIGTAARVLLCLGPTATVMAADLCEAGVHAVDLGHIGMFLRKYRQGEPMVVTKADKAA